MQLFISSLPALLAAVVVSVLPIGVLFAIPTICALPFGRTAPRRSTALLSEGALNIMLAFAAGSLIGDALLHLIVHGLHDFGFDPYLARRQMLYCVWGIGLFFAMDAVVRHYSQAPPESPALSISEIIASPTATPGGNARQRRRPPPSPDIKMLSTARTSSTSPVISPALSSCSSTHECRTGSGLLSLCADAFHNFTDGLALVGAFAKDYRVGITTTIAIFLHEIPHQIGDYAILLKVGYSHRRAIRMQLVTATAAFIGVILGTAVNSGALPGLAVLSHDALLPLAAGGFLYVALSSILPEVLSFDGEPSTIRSLAARLGAFASGVALMLLLD